VQPSKSAAPQVTTEPSSYMSSLLPGRAAQSWISSMLLRWPWRLQSPPSTAKVQVRPIHSPSTAARAHSDAWMRSATLSCPRDGAAVFARDELRPRSQQIHRQALTLGRAAHSSAVFGRHGCLRRGSDRLSSQQIPRQALPRSQQNYCKAIHQTQTLVFGCATHSPDGTGRRCDRCHLDVLRILLGSAARYSVGPGPCCYPRQRQKGSKSRQIQRQPLQQMRIPKRGCVHILDGAAVSAMVSITPCHSSSIAKQ
jgi:hypothetical protein